MTQPFPRILIPWYRTFFLNQKRKRRASHDDLRIHTTLSRHITVPKVVMSDYLKKKTPNKTMLCHLRRRKKSCLFPLTRPTLIFHADPKVFFSSISEKNPN